MLGRERSQSFPRKKTPLASFTLLFSPSCVCMHAHTRAQDDGNGRGGK